MKEFRKATYRINSDPAIVYYPSTFGPTGGASGNTACGLANTGLTLYKLTSGPIIAGTVFYSETLVPTLFNGEGLFWNNINGFSYQITSTGVVVGINECSTAELFCFIRDGSQNDDPTFHIPRVDYIDLDGNPQVFYPTPTDNICGCIEALEITDTIYVFTC